MNLPLNCRNIEAGKPFLATLARFMLEHYGKNSPTFTSALILLPSRRACTALREAFLEETDGAPLLLPRIQPIGEASLPFAAAIPEPISELRRHLLLTSLIHRFDPTISLPGAVQRASHLGEFMDEAQREGISLDRLASLVPAELAVHWQQTLEFLRIISQHWPSILREEGVIDPVDHRTRMLRAVATSWRDAPPNYPIIAAGSTGSQPATAALISIIATLPGGMVILPGLDTQMPDRQWDMIEPTHPQYGLKQLLETMGCKRSDVKPLSAPSSPSRATCLRVIFAPPEATASWAATQLPLEEGASGMRLLTAATQFEEARAIAMSLRKTLETPGKTAALITPDRTLARLVKAQMKRYGVTINDSAGIPLSHTPTGSFLRLIVDVVFSQAAPSPLLALLRHPFTAGGVETQQCRSFSRLLEITMLRGIRRTPGMQALVEACDTPALKTFLTEFTHRMESLAACANQRETPLKTLLECHMQFAQWLVTTPTSPGETQLWGGDAGNQVAAFLGELVQQADIFPAIDPQSYPALLDTLLSTQIYRTRVGNHPRLHILGPIEARLQHFDYVILGGLNEGTWPQSVQPDPWMSRPMRSDYGLPPPERAIGQSAHELFMFCAAPEVLLTRALKVEGSPTVASRWLVRMHTLIHGINPDYLSRMQADDEYEVGACILDAQIPIPPSGRPQPTPPVAARPRKLRVTAIDTWLRDPYMVYAAHILKLRKLEPLDKEPDAADFGMIVHKALEYFIGACPNHLPDDALSVLLTCGKKAFAHRIDRPAVSCLWWPRFEMMAQWLIEREGERRHTIAHIHSELEGQWETIIGDKPFTLTTRIDRLEIGTNGSMAIVDYKTGTLPTSAEIEAGLANQLPLEALIATRGTLLPAIANSGSISSLEYWKLSGNYEDCDSKHIRVEGIEEAAARLASLVQLYDHAGMPYAANIDPAKAPRFNDFAHLTRHSEWEII